MMKCGGRISGEQEIRVQRRKASCGVIRTAGYQAVREKVVDRGRKTGDRISELVNLRLGYQVNRKPGGRVSGPQGIR